MSWQDLDGNKFKQTFTGFPAIIIQHELDHLNGVLFTKHVMEQGEQLYKSHKDEKGDDVAEGKVLPIQGIAGHRDDEEADRGARHGHGEGDDIGADHLAR